VAVPREADAIAGSSGGPAADEIIAALGLAPHPEGGWYRETFRDVPPAGGRGAWSAIQFLLRRGERSAWHRLLDADEVWYHHAGAPLVLQVAQGGSIQTFTLGSDPVRGDLPQALVPAGAWQTAHSQGPWTLVGCHVNPAFDFAAFELAPPGWQPS
jgi:uncharacterized protein